MNKAEPFHLSAGAGAGDRARAETVRANLHKYFEFEQKRLPHRNATNSSAHIP